jgi:hypothetical protein
MPILIGNFLLALAALLILPVFIGRKAASGANAGAQDVTTLIYAIAGLAGLTIAGLLAFAAYRCLRDKDLAPPTTFLLVVGPFLAGIGTAAIICWALPALPADTNYYLPLLCAGLEFLPLTVIGDYLMRGYDRNRPGALMLWRLMGVVMLLWIVSAGYRLEPYFSGWKEDPSLPLLQWLGHTVEGVFVVLVAAWLGLYASNIAMCIVAAMLRSKRVAMYDRERYDLADLKRSISTCLMAASLPAPFFLAIVLTLWALVFNYLPSLPSVEFCPWFTAIFDHTIDGRDFIASMIDKSANNLFLVYTILMTLAGCLIVWALIPSVFLEVFPGNVADTKPSSFASRFLGGWLDGAFVTLALRRSSRDSASS